MLFELICIDLEFRWRNSTAGRRTLEDYLERFPKLISLDRLPVDLIGEEYRARRRWGDRPSHDEFLSRFREQREQIAAELARIDQEMEGEVDQAPPPGMPWIPPPPEPDDLITRVPWLSDRDFLLKRLIGQGRMGKVYEAEQHGSGLGVAVKFLRKPLLRHPDVVRRFIGEAEMVAGLRHPNIVGTLGLGRTRGGSYFIVMDLVKGPNLSEIGRLRAITVDEAVRWSIQTSEALEFAHENGVVHCDLKPANLLLDESGKVRVADFGLARSLVGETPWAAEVEGTAPFMAPEQASPCWGPIDRRTDVYGIGAILFTLLTGRPPFIGRRLPDILAEVISATPVVSPESLRPNLPRPVGDVCRKCLAKAPAERFQSAREVREALVGLGMIDS